MLNMLSSGLSDMLVQTNPIDILLAIPANAYKVDSHVQVCMT